MRYFALLSIALVAGGCHRGPATPEAAYVELEHAIAAADADAFYQLLDEQTHWSVESVLHDQKLMRTIITAKYPEGESEKALAPLAAAEARNAADFFSRVDVERKIVVGYRRRLGSVSGAIKLKPDGAESAWVARADGMPFHFHHDKRGWYCSDLEPDWSLEKDRTIHALHTVQENAKLYQKAEPAQ